MLWHHCVQVNAALDELAGHAATNLRTMAAVRNPAGGGGAGAAKLAPAERKRATDLLHGVAVSRMFFRHTSPVNLCFDVAQQGRLCLGSLQHGRTHAALHRKQCG